MRLVVTGHDADGRSTVVSDTEVAGRGMVSLFTTGLDPGDLGPHAHDGEHIANVPPAGSASWFLVDLSPEETMREALRRPIVGMEPDGWHTTPTVDFLMILNGSVWLALDTGEVELHAGDCVVQRATRHAWRNRSNEPVRMAAVMVRPG